MGDSSGTFTVDTDGIPVVGHTRIYDYIFNAFVAELEAALSNRICKDGQTTITQNIPMNSKKLTGLTSGSALSDSCSIANLMGNTGVYVATVGGTVDAITLTPSPAAASYVAGQEFLFISTGANTGATTVDVSSLGAKAITKNGATALSAADIASGAMVRIVYDGTRFQKI
jgi:hypothetical protein